MAPQDPPDPAAQSTISGAEARFNALEVLRVAAWRNYDDRRSYEWKFSFGLWTALVVATGALIIGEPEKVVGLHHNVRALAATGFLTFLITVVHVWWSHNCRFRNDRDRYLSYQFEEPMCEMVGVSYKGVVLPIFAEPDDREKPARHARWKPERGLRPTLRNYWHLTHMLITLFLNAAVFLAMWARVEPWGE